MESNQISFIPNEVLPDSQHNVNISTNTVLNTLLISDHPLTATEVCRDTELSRPTVMRILTDLIKANLATVQTAKRAHIKGGRRPQLYELNKEHHRSLILRINRYTLNGIVLDAAGNITETVSKPIHSSEKITSELTALASEMLEKITSPIYFAAVVVMGIVLNGKVSRSDSYPALDNNEWMQGIDTLLEKNGHYCNVIALNDAKIAAKWMYHQAALTKNSNPPNSLIAIHCSEELGCGLVFDGLVLEGAHGAAGEFLQTHTGDWHNISAHLKHLERTYGINIRDIFAKSQEGGTREFIKPLGTMIGQALIPMIHLLDPDAVVFGGAIVDCGDTLIDAIKAELESCIPSPPTVFATPQGTPAVTEGSRLFALEKARQRLFHETR